MRSIWCCSKTHVMPLKSHTSQNRCSQVAQNTCKSHTLIQRKARTDTSSSTWNRKLPNISVFAPISSRTRFSIHTLLRHKIMCLRNALCLQLLTKADGKLTKAITSNAKPDLVSSLCECAQNVLKGNILKSAQKTKLRRYRKQLRNLVKRTSLKKKTKLLQTSGFVSSLLAPLATSVIFPVIKACYSRIWSTRWK